MANYIHGQSWPKASKEYRTWKGMLGRCQPFSKDAPRYFNRGIRVCERWTLDFMNFYADMKNSPSEEHQIDRIDNNKGYEPGNCKWSTRKEQGNNKSNNRFYELDGRRFNIRELAAYLNCNTASIWAHLQDNKPLEWIANHFRNHKGMGRNHKLYTAFGKTMLIPQWAKEFGCSTQSIRFHLNNGRDFQWIAEWYQSRKGK